MMPRIRDLNRHDQPFVTVEELAEYFGVSDDTIRRELGKGALAFVRVGRQIRIPIVEARRYEQSGPPQ